MDCDTEDKIQKEIRRRAFARSDFLRQAEQKRQGTKHTLDALQEVTGLPCVDLETIANDVRRSIEPDEKDFFSIKNQFLMVFGAFGFIIFFIWMLIKY
ncbi:MAG: hypothetical protein ACE5HX_19250 [bacterium]